MSPFPPDLRRPSAGAWRFVLVRTSAPFTVASHSDTIPVDSETLVARTRSTEMRVGEGDDEPVIVRGGRFVFETVNEDLLISLLPPLLHVRSNAPSSDGVRALLAMNEAESLTPGPGSEFVIARLMELPLVELLRDQALPGRLSQAGMLRGLADPVIACTLTALHGDLRRLWTTAMLARLCGSSRSAFNMRFTEIVGVPPMGYLQRWRIAVAKDELGQGRRSMAEIALLTGFRSSSAFSSAFSRAVGCSPKRFVEGAER